ncbi:MAG: YfiR family protein [Deltaproteobacteria bacterium]|nr:YfiR family protein [Deltaproteobacteria bacterium]
MRRVRFPLFLSAGVLLVALVPSRRAVEAELPPGKQAIFLARVIAYDANLRQRAGATVNIGVLAKKGDKESERTAGLLVKAFKPIEAATLLGLPVRVSRMYFGGRESLDRAVREDGIDTLYVCGGLGAGLSDVKAVARARKVLTMGSEEEQLKAGLSLGVFEVDGKNTIVVNLEASREEGVAFGPELLRLATIVK